jgi:hypothetical protein
MRAQQLAEWIGRRWADPRLDGATLGYQAALASWGRYDPGLAANMAIDAPQPASVHTIGEAVLWDDRRRQRIVLLDGRGRVFLVPWDARIDDDDAAAAANEGG